MSIQLQIVSDLHLEMTRGQPYTPAKTAAEVVIPAGDIHHRTPGIDWAREQSIQGPRRTALRPANGGRTWRTRWRGRPR
jgi:hypothetical protein